ncbi:MAG: GNAT family N-acetyltransferase [Clostridia bacterium]|nr:GNAT family N-acetyltransferase [Clostridia bacterium]
MDFKRFDTPMSFYPEIKELLHEEEITNILTIGLLSGAKPNDDFSQCFYAAGYNYETLELALMVHGLHLILITKSNHGLNEAAKFVVQEEIEFPGVIGPRPFVDEFVEQLNLYSSNHIQLAMSQRIYKLTQVNKINPSKGYMRPAKLSDLELVLQWNREFALMDGNQPDMEKMKIRRSLDIEAERLFLWIVDDEIVSMTNLSKSSEKGVIVSLVFTPESQRRKGYASALVASVSEYALKSYEYCALYTDLSNPTSNSIYMKIGYEPIVDSAMYLKR